MVKDESGSYYYLTVGTGINPSVTLVKATSEGRLAATAKLGNAAQEFDLYGMDRTVVNLAGGAGVLGLLSSRTKQDFGDGLHHQGSFVAFFDPATLAPLKNHGQNSGHSFDNRLIFDGRTFISLDLGDNYPRGIIIHKLLPQAKAGKVIFTYKTSLGATPHPDRNGPDGQPLPAGAWSNDNRTYTELGDVISTPLGYLVAFAAEAGTDNRLAKTNLNESRNMGLVLVTPHFERVAQEQDVVPEGLILSPGEITQPFGFYTFDGNPVAQQNRGVVWLSNYRDKVRATAARPKVADLGNGRYMVMWEQWTETKFTSTQAVVIDARGEITSPLINLGAKVRLPRGERVVVSGNQILWPSSTGKTLEINVWDLQNVP